MEAPSSLESRYRAARHASPAPASAADDFFDDTPKPSQPHKGASEPPRTTLRRTMRRHRRWIITAAIVLAIAALACWWFRGVQSGIPGVDKAKYQAVFLVDGTQYVGKLARLDDSHYKLTNAFYVSANQTPVASDEAAAPASGGQVALVKLESGLLNAENEITIPKDKVLLYENLKPDGQAAKLIDSNK